jgi:hypothetical protein
MMLKPDKKLALEILDALHVRSGSRVPHPTMAM